MMDIFFARKLGETFGWVATWGPLGDGWWEWEGMGHWKIMKFGEEAMANPGDGSMFIQSYSQLRQFVKEMIEANEKNWEKLDKKHNNMLHLIEQYAPKIFCEIFVFFQPMGDLNLPWLSDLSQHIGFSTLRCLWCLGRLRQKTSMLGTNRYGYKYDTGWWFHIFFIFIPTWGNDPIWQIFFRWVQTTN